MNVILTAECGYPVVLYGVFDKDLYSCQRSEGRNSVYNERREQIRNLLLTKPFISIKELEEMFPDVSGMLEIAQVLETVRSMGMEPVDILRQTENDTNQSGIHLYPILVMYPLG